MTKYFLDEEFLEDGKTIDLISIGIACQDGRELYLQSCEFNPKSASLWVRENVLCTLRHCPHTDSDAIARMLRQHKKGQCVDQLRGYLYRCPWRSRNQIRNEVLAFMDVEKYGKPELWGWCCSYDHVVFCQLFGAMMDLPQGFPHCIYDIQCDLNRMNITDEMLPEQEEGLHTALADARYIAKLWKTYLGERSNYISM